MKEGRMATGILLTPEQIAEQERKKRVQEFNQSVSGGIRAIGEAALTPVKIGQSAAAAGIRAGSNIKDLPDYSTPGYATQNVRPTAQASAEKAVTANPQQALAGQQAADEISRRAVNAGLAAFRQPVSRQTAPPPQQSEPLTINTDQPGDMQMVTPSTRGGARNIYRGTGIGIGAQGGEIVARRNAQGIAEFTNDPAAQRRSAGRFGLPGGTFNVMPSAQVQQAAGAPQQPDQQRRGGGIDVFTVGDPVRDMLTSDDFRQRRAGLAMLQELQQQAQLQQQEQQEQGRLGIQQQEADIARTEAQQRGISAGLDRNIRRQELANQQRLTDLQAQRTQQEVEAGQLTLSQQKRLADLQARMTDRNLSDAERQQAAAEYQSLTSKPISPADRFMTVRGGSTDMGGEAASRVFDRVTGRYVDQAPQQSQQATTRAVGTRSEVNGRVAVWDGSRWVEEKN
jgi:hypothetical protein